MMTRDIGIERTSRALVFVILVASVGLGCAPGGGETGPDTCAGRSCDAGIAGGGDGSTTPTTGCATMGCPGGSFCSVTNACIPDGTCAMDDDCDVGYACDAATSACVVGSACGAEAFIAEAVPPNMLIALDRSCSMRREAAGVPKWTSAVNAIVDLTRTHADTIRWGLTLFPDLEGNDCRQDAAFPVPTGPANEATIQGILTSALDTSNPLYPDFPCVTNVDTAMEQAATDPALSDPDRSSYVLLVSDGAQSGSCRGGSDDRTLAALDALSARGVPTYVVGFGDAVDAPALSEFARRGGTARTGGTEYYQADDAAGLAAAFDTIVRGVASCEYHLDRAPADLALVYVFLDDTTMVGRDTAHGDGWDYDPTAQTVTFYGGPCDALRAGTARDVDIVFGCPEPVLE